MNRYFYLFISFFIGVLTAGAQNFPEDGAIYRISNTVRDNSVLVENYMTHQLKGGTKKEGEAAQLWLFKQNGEGWNIQNVFTGRYIKIETSNSKLYTTDTEDVALDVFYVSRNNNYTTECYNIVNNKGGNYGIHCETDGDIVPWYASTSSFDGSEWTYEKVDFTAEDIAKVRENYYKFNELLSNREQIMEKYSAFFEDESCSQLKSEYTSMSDDELTAAMEGCGESLISIALKVKNGSWGKRELEFRVNSYGPYTDPDYWGEKLKTKYYSWLNNPTGICADAGDMLYIFVGKEPKEGSTLELDLINENNHKTERVQLKKGLNIIPVVKSDRSLFIVYTADTKKDYVLADFDSIPIHIEGGYVNGYWDKGRHNDADWVDITRNLAKHKYIFIKGDYMMLFMNRSLLISSDVCPNTISDAINWWDNMSMWQQGIMGLEEYIPSRFNNRQCGVSYEGSGLMSATNHVTNYVETCLHDVMSYEDVMETSGHCWGPSHEVGHVHQGAINMIGCTEASNNLFSNIVLFNLGKFVTWGDGVDVMAEYYVDDVAWSLQGIGLKMRMFWQLYLYYHVAGNNPDFYPTLFKLLRKDPMEKTSGSSNDNSARNDLLKFAEKCCEASGEDMTKFFEAWGFFKPMSRAVIDDYGTWVINSTTRMISDTKKKLAKYTKKAAAIEFIEDRVAPTLRTDGGEGYKLEYVEGKFGELGLYTAYMTDSIDVVANGYVYTKSGKQITFSKGGSGAVGFKVYNSNDELLTFTNRYYVNLTDEMISQELKVVAVSANGTETVLKTKNEGTEEEQFESLNEAIASAESYLKMKDTASKNVGYFFETVLIDLTAVTDSAKAVVEHKDQSVRTYGQWAILIDKEISELLANPDSRVKIQSGNTYQLYNIRYTDYTMYCESGKLTCQKGTSTPKARRFTFTSTGKENEYYISNNGSYINFIGRSQQATASTTKKSEALKFTVGEHGVGRTYIYKSGDTDLGIHSSQQYVIVGWNHDEEPSLWRLVTVDAKKEKADAAALNELIDEATGIYYSIVDTTNVGSVTFNDGVEVVSATLAADVEAMMAKVADSQEAVTNKYYNLCPALIEELTAAIATVKAGYTVNTGIGNIAIDEKASTIYDIRGRKVERITASGIYVVDGKKVYVNK